MKKLEIPIIIIVILGIVGCVFLFNKGDKKAAPEEKEVLGVVGSFYTEYNVWDSLKDGEYYTVSRESSFENLGLVDREGKIIFNPEYKEIVYDDSGYFILKKDLDDTHLVDVSGKEYLSGNYIRIGKIDDKYYFFVTYDTGDTTNMKIYNDSFEMIRSYNNVSAVLGRYVYGKDLLIDFLNDEPYGYDKTILGISDCKIFVKGTEAYVIDYETLELKHIKEFKENEDGSVVLDGEKKDYERGPDKLELNEDYYFLLEDDVYNFYDKKNDKVYKHTYYTEIGEGVYLVDVITSSDDMSTMIFFKNGEMISTSSSDDYVSYANKIAYLKTKDKIEFYNFDGKALDLKCDDVRAAYDDNNICERDKKFYLIDKDLKDFTEGYDEIKCNEKLCTVKKDELYGALYNGEKILDITYPDLKAENKFLVSKMQYSYKNQIILLGKDNIIDNLVYEENDYKNLDVEKVIKDYSLDSIRTEIEGNKELFQKYASLVTTNKNLIIQAEGKEYDYRKYVLMSFKVVIAHKDLLEENRFMKALRELSFEYDANMGMGTAGRCAGTKIYLGANYLGHEDVIFHELLHFVDENINDNKDDLVILNCDGKNVGFSGEVDTEGKSCWGNGWLQILTEPGAELYSSIYLRNYDLISYRNGLHIYGALSYIFGYDVMENIFFDGKTNRKLFELLSSAGMSKEDFIDFEDRAFSCFGNGETPTDEDFNYVLKYLVEIYKGKKGAEWYNDKEFMFILNMVFEYNTIDSKIVGDEIVSKYNAIYSHRIIGQLTNKYDLTSEYTYFTYGGKSYFNFNYGTKGGYVLVEYDYKNNKVINSKVMK